TYTLNRDSITRTTFSTSLFRISFLVSTVLSPAVFHIAHLILNSTLQTIQNNILHNHISPYTQSFVHNLTRECDTGIQQQEQAEPVRFKAAAIANAMGFNNFGQDRLKKV
ncbi:hypothetical protein ACJX0J_013708, partial [Zea mays]